MSQSRFFSLSLSANVVLSVVVIWLLIGPALAPNKALSPGMIARYENSPLTLLLDEKFPHDPSFKLFDKDDQLLVSGDRVIPGEHESASKRVGIAIGNELGLSCFYSVQSKPAFQEIQLTTGECTFLDLNADGQYDSRLWLAPSNGKDALTRIEIWYESSWQEVIGRGKDRYTHSLKDGAKVNFDKSIGQWTPGATGLPMLNGK